MIRLERRWTGWVALGVVAVAAVVVWLVQRPDGPPGQGADAGAGRGCIPATTWALAHGAAAPVGAVLVRSPGGRAYVPAGSERRWEDQGWFLAEWCTS